MNSEDPTLSEPERTRKTYLIVGAIAGAALLLLILVAIYANRTPQRASTRVAVRDTDKLEGARRDLAKATDHGTCRNVIQQINLFLAEHPKQRPPALTDEQRAFLSEHCLGNSSDGEMAEVEGGVFTLLDARYLSECFLFRDAAQSLEVNSRSQAEQADAAFRWAVRQVRLRESSAASKTEGEPVPPEFVVRRGWGTVQERALVFLALLQQLGVDGCLVVAPAGNGASSQCWACGALVNANEKEAAAKKEIRLFDPRLGIPLPGPTGEGVATLADVRKNPDLLKALTVNSIYPYDVTPEQVASSEIQLVAPLSGLSPRMAVLQKDLLGPSIKGRLTIQPKDSLERFMSVAASLNLPVRFDKRWTAVLRRFLPPDEGGSAKDFPFSLRLLPGFLGRNADSDTTRMTRQKLYDLQLAAWGYFPERARDLPWGADLGRRPRSIYGQLFSLFYLEPRRPRDLVLRGQYDEALGNLNLIRDKYDADKKRLSDALANGLDGHVKEWVDHAFEAYGALVRAEQVGANVPEAKHLVDQIWGQNATPLIVLIEGYAAKPLNAESVYLMALAWQEQAVRLQARLDRDRQAERVPTAADAEAARIAWQTALSWWRTLETDPAAFLSSVSARRLEAEAYAALGEGAAARAILEDLSGDLTPLEKTARLFLANRIKK
jgi:hypothetical protein